MAKYAYKKIFLDEQYQTTFIDCCLVKGLVPNLDVESADRKEYLFLPGIKKLYRYLVLFEHIDFSDSIYDLSRLIEMGLIAENSQCNSNSNPEQQHMEEAMSIMSVYKKPIINQVRAETKKKLKDLQHPSSPNSNFWKSVSPTDILYYCQDMSGKVLNLSKSFYEILPQMDVVSGVGDSPEEQFLFNLYHADISSLLQGIRNNLAYGLRAAKDGACAYASNFLTLASSKTSKEIVDDVYYFVETALPEEANIMPMPQTLQDVFDMRKSPYVKSFRSVMNEWSDYISNNDFDAAKKIKKDIIKANSALEKVGKFKRGYDSFLTRTSFCLGGFIPAIGQAINVISWAEPYIVRMIEERNNWVLLSSLQHRQCSNLINR